MNAKVCPGTGRGCMTTIPGDRVLCYFCTRSAVLIALREHFWTLRRVA